MCFWQEAIDEARLLLGWRNDRLTLLSSYNTDVLKFDHHVSWLEATPSNTLLQLLIPKGGGRTINTVRLDLEVKGDSYELIIPDATMNDAFVSIELALTART